LFVPPNYDGTQKYPLVFWLHGGAGRGSDNSSQISGGNENGTHIWTTPANQAQLPAFVLAPQCREDRNWSDPELNEISAQLQIALAILASVQKEFSIDPDRIYLAGQSMGGLGVWALLQARPDRWAAALVLCAFDNFTNVKEIARIPVWVVPGRCGHERAGRSGAANDEGFEKISRPTALFGISQDRPRRLAESLRRTGFIHLARSTKAHKVAHLL
jgi:predicted peptidase